MNHFKGLVDRLWHLSSRLRDLALVGCFCSVCTKHFLSWLLGLSLLPPLPIPLKPSHPPKQPQQQGRGQRSSNLIHRRLEWPHLGAGGPSLFLSTLPRSKLVDFSPQEKAPTSSLPMFSPSGLSLTRTPCVQLQSGASATSILPH